MSSLPGCFDWNSGRMKRESRIPIAPTGRLIVKIHLQSTYSTRYPPSVGPTAGATRRAMPNMPMAAPNWFRGTMRKIIAMVVGMIIPPPMAWMTRAKMRESMLHERLQNREPTTKTPMDRM